MTVALPARGSALQPVRRQKVVVIGAGQAGLSVAHELQKHGIRPLVLEKNWIGYAWEKQRWDSFCLVTPNWQCNLPDFPYDGPEPQGFMSKAQVLAYIRRFARHVQADVWEGVTVQRVSHDGEIYRLSTSEQELEADQIIVATGSYHIPKRHPLARQLPASILQVDARDYRNPASLPAGPVLVVGSGQSGCQIAEDLFLDHREVHLSVGSAPRSPRRYRGRDVVDWLERMGYYSMPIAQHSNQQAQRSKTNHYLTGRDGGREINLRYWAQQGLHLHGRLQSLGSSHISFFDDLGINLDRADAVYCRIRSNIDAWITQQGIRAPEESAYVPCWEPSPGEDTGLDLSKHPLAAVIWCMGYRSDFRWINAPVFDGSGFPAHHRGVTRSPGLYFIGLPWLHTWGSGRLSGVATDARHLAELIAQRGEPNGL